MSFIQPRVIFQFIRCSLAGAAILVLIACGESTGHDDAGAIALIAQSTCTPPNFNESVANLTNAPAQYSSLCSSCHGATGKGGNGGPSLQNCSSCGTYQGLAARIHCTMPYGSPTACTDDCARDIAKYVRTSLQ